MIDAAPDDKTLPLDPTCPVCKGPHDVDEVFDGSERQCGNCGHRLVCVTYTDGSAYMQKPIKRTLSRRQLQVAKLLAVGMRNSEIAKQLGISHKTVDSHRGMLLRVLDLDNNVALARHALREGWVTLDAPGASP